MERNHEVDIRIHALNLATVAWREIFKPKPEGAGEDWVAQEILVTARVFRNWLMDGDGEDPTETPEQSAAIVDANLERMGLTLGGES